MASIANTSVSTSDGLDTARSSSSSGASQTITQAASKLSLWCDRIIEAGWLAAIIVVPLFFDIYSSRVFEPDKLTTLRSIAIVMATAWLVKWFEERLNPYRDRSINWRTPLVLPTLFMVVIYMISTALSVAPRTSLLGSYQRLQGTYTTFSYFIIFFMVLQGLRTRAQVSRLVNFLILNSLPIAFYGMLQRNLLDPLPWGGDVTERVAGNMGNAIFIAAYLIMTLFMTLIKITESFIAVFTSDEAKLSDVVRAALLIFIALLNIYVVMLLSGSRGPQLGLGAGLFFTVLLLIQLIHLRKLRAILTVGCLTLVALLIGGLIALNVSDAGMFQSLRKLPFFGRISTAFDTQGGTNLVRVLIWQGDVKLVAPHDPISNPDGSPDAFNALRPLVGYGPESMYVAYNRFYQPALANIEARNASPDRSHNETWDSLVITGGIGFLAYMFLFASIFYFGFRWIGMIRRRSDSLLFAALWIGGAVIAGAYALSTRPELFGVAVAVGITIGLTLFTTVSSLISAFRTEEDLHTPLPLRDRLLIIGVIATVIAHFVEIHTGIAIAATRSHFWILIATMVVVGLGLLREQRAAGITAAIAADAAAAPAPVAVEPEAPAPGSAAARRRRRAQQAAGAAPRTARANTSRGLTLPDWFYPAAMYGVFLGLMLGVMAFDFVNNTDRMQVTGKVFVNSLTVVKGQTSLGILAMFLLTLVAGMAVFVADLRREGTLRSTQEYLAAGGVIGSIALLLWVAFGTFLAGRLVDFVNTQANQVDDILKIADQLAAFPTYLYVLIALAMVAGAWLTQREAANPPLKGFVNAGSLGIAAVVGLFSLITISTSNLQPIAADIIYKQANPWDGQGSRQIQQGTNIQGWDLAIEHYRRAIALAPNEDFYYLWLGRALLEKAKTTQSQNPAGVIGPDASFQKVIDNGPTNWNRVPYTTDLARLLPSAVLNREDLLNAAKVILVEARVINPLNTDHSANLARMWRQAGDIATDPKVKQERYDASLKEYAAATSLSPQNALLYNEWATLLAYGLGKTDEARAKLAHSIEIDKKFDQTYLILGDLNYQNATKLDAARQQQLQIIASTPATDTAKLAAAKQALAQAEAPWRAALLEARNWLTQAISISPNSTQAMGFLADIDLKLGDTTSAISRTEGLAAANPSDWNIWRNLALLYRDTGAKDKAKEAAQKAFQLAPQDQQASMKQLVDQLGAGQ